MHNSIIWIKDGVLLDKMPVNQAAFAFSSLLHMEPADRPPLEELINFGFEHSGSSCEEKMQKYNEVHGTTIIVDAANEHYQRIAAAAYVEFFPGISSLLHELSRAEVLNFISTATPQPVLDAWMDEAGKFVKPYFTEALGNRPGFRKGKDHFAYVYGFTSGKILQVADAKSEIASARMHSRYGVSSIGFAYAPPLEGVVAAVSEVRGLCQKSSEDPVLDIPLYPDMLRLPTQAALKQELLEAGASHVVCGERNSIVGNLRAYLANEHVL